MVNERRTNWSISPSAFRFGSLFLPLVFNAGAIYTSDSAHKHAVAVLTNGDSFVYDANGSMITRTVGGQTFNLSYDAENRMTGVTGAATANFVYDDTGARVIAAEGVTTTVYVGSYFEWHGTITDTVKYYYANTVRVAMRKGDGPALFLLGDHLGSTNRLVHADGTPVTPGGVRLYKAWGESRYEPDGELATEFRYTGQFEDGYITLYWYGSRWYDPALSRWVQPDQIVPVAQQGTQALDRYAYVNNSPLNFIDPTGYDLEQIYFNRYGRIPISRSLEYQRRIIDRNNSLLIAGIPVEIKSKVFLPEPVPTAAISSILTPVPCPVIPTPLPNYGSVPPTLPAISNPSIPDPTNIFGVNISYTALGSNSGGVGFEIMFFPDGTIGLFGYQGSGTGQGVGGTLSAYFGSDPTGGGISSAIGSQEQSNITIAAPFGISITTSESGVITYGPAFGSEYSITYMEYRYSLINLWNYR